MRLVKLTYRWTDFGFHCSVVDAIGAERAISAAARGGHGVAMFRMSEASPYFAAPRRPCVRRWLHVRKNR